jgi:membrane-associated protein
VWLANGKANLNRLLRNLRVVYNLKLEKGFKMRQLLRVYCLCLALCFSIGGFSQETTLAGKITDQYELPVSGAEVRDARNNELLATSDTSGSFSIAGSKADSITLSKIGYQTIAYPAKNLETSFILERDFTWSDLLNPLFYIRNGGLWLLVFIVFAETGLMVGFFLPGDSLLFVAGIYSGSLVDTLIPGGTGSDFLDVLILIVLVSASGIFGNMLGYWFGRKSGPFLFTRKDTFLFKRKHLLRAKEFYDQHGGQAIVFARFLPIVRTFAPVIAGIVQMEWKKFMFYNILGCVAWVASMLLAGHYLDKLFIRNFNFDLKQHLELIVLGIVLVTTLPVIYKIFFGKKAVVQETPPTKNL